MWSKLLAELTAAGLVDLQDWNSYSIKTGWALRLKHAGRTIVYLAPCHGHFRASFALGANAVKEARVGLPEKVVELIDSAKRYAEGTAVRITVKRPADIDNVGKLAAIKVRS